MLTTTIIVTKSGIGTLIGTTTTISYGNRNEKSGPYVLFGNKDVGSSMTLFENMMQMIMKIFENIVENVKDIHINFPGDSHKVDAHEVSIK